MLSSLLPSVLALLPLATGSPLSIEARQSCTSWGMPGPMMWTVEDFDFHASYIFTTPAHQNSWGYVSFNLSNPAVPFVVPCSGQSDQLEDFFYGNQIFTCTLPDDHPRGAGHTTFNFSRPTNQLQINQTWACYDEDPQWGTYWKASGAVNLTLECSDTLYNNPNWTEGQIYSDRTVTCAKTTVPVKAAMIQAIG